MDKRTRHCPNCGAPIAIEIGETDFVCQFCASKLHFIPSREELTVVKKREEMKYRERVATRKLAMEKQLRQEEAEKWRQTAAKVAVAALPLVGDTAGRALFNSILKRGSGCIGCGCIVIILVIAAAVVLSNYLLH